MPVAPNKDIVKQLGRGVGKSACRISPSCSSSLLPTCPCVLEIGPCHQVVGLVSFAKVEVASKDDDVRARAGTLDEPQQLLGLALPVVLIHIPLLCLVQFPSNQVCDNQVEDEVVEAYPNPESALPRQNLTIEGGKVAPKARPKEEWLDVQEWKPFENCWSPFHFLWRYLNI